ncbi:unnamed protein product [Amoebophrya sp. A120]|nr:unnamed protein product [Amoebophrya sp. A120]|eukprot:GSA120T00011723001.1
MNKKKETWVHAKQKLSPTCWRGRKHGLWRSRLRVFRVPPRKTYLYANEYNLHLKSPPQRKYWETV